jgi:uncharacterized protein YgbK (DUF1537 family)
MLLGCIADDFTGASDVANVLTKGGMNTVQYSGVPGRDAEAGVESGVVALKTRTAPASAAIAQSMAALAWLQRQGVRQIFFKYCSTFDSTPAGNIGPVADALADALGASHVVVCPAFPSLGRTLFNGHLFVGDRLLSESGMQNHPLTPMTDSDLRRWLRRQARSEVGYVPAAIVAQGSAAIRAALEDSPAKLVVVDAIRDGDLLAIGSAVTDMPLLTGGSGVATGLPAIFRARGELADAPRRWSGISGRAAILSGSCSNMTRAQVAYHRSKHAAFEITADAAMDEAEIARAAVAFAFAGSDPLPLIYSSADPETVAAAQARYGRQVVAERMERVMAKIAQGLVDGGTARLVVAGGETSGAVVEGLGIEALEVGPEIDPGVPALLAAERKLALALKSGNFGREAFFERAAAKLGGAE